jgi:hypothetical protein
MAASLTYVPVSLTQKLLTQKLVLVIYYFLEAWLNLLNCLGFCNVVQNFAIQVSNLILPFDHMYMTLYRRMFFI